MPISSIYTSLISDIYISHIYRHVFARQCYMNIAKLIDIDDKEKPTYLELLVFQLWNSLYSDNMLKLSCLRILTSLINHTAQTNSQVWPSLGHSFSIIQFNQFNCWILSIVFNSHPMHFYYFLLWWIWNYNNRERNLCKKSWTIWKLLQRYYNGFFSYLFLIYLCSSPLLSYLSTRYWPLLLVRNKEL